MNPTIPVIANMGRYSISATCAFLGIGRATLYRWVEEGKIARGGYRTTNGRPFFYGKEIQRVLKDTTPTKPMKCPA